MSFLPNDNKEKYESKRSTDNSEERQQDNYDNKEGHESRPSSSGTMGSNFSSRPSTAATSRPNSRQTHQRPYSAVSSVGSLHERNKGDYAYYEDHGDVQDQDAYHYSDMPDSRGDSRGLTFLRKRWREVWPAACSEVRPRLLYPDLGALCDCNSPCVALKAARPRHEP